MATGSISRIEDTDALASLEERVLRAVELVGQLRQEKDSITRQLETMTADKDAALASIEELRADNARLVTELDGLRGERKQVRSRIEKLLGQMDLLAN